MRLPLIITYFLLTGAAWTQTLTHYGSAQDSTGDSKSLAGIGNHDNILVPLQSAALSDSVAQQYGIKVGDSFSVNAGGQTYNLIYADTVPASFTNSAGQVVQEGPRVDIYDPNNVLGGANSFSAPVTSINSGPVLFGNGITNTGTAGTPSFTHAQMPPLVSTLLSKFEGAGKAWVVPIKNAASSLFWILALISLTFTGIWLVIKQSDLMEICAELVRYILFTGFFWWLLNSAPDLSGKIIQSLWQVGGQASGTGNEIFPGDLITLGMQVFNNAITHINWFQPESVFVPVLITLIIFIVCVLVAANVVLLLCAAWVVLYAGMIFLGFGGCRWTSEMAINYYRSILGIGVSLMTMLLIVGIGIQFLQDLVNTAGATPDVPSLAVIMGAAILLAVISHKLPKIVAEMATGGGYGGHVGGYSTMALISGMMAATSLAARAAAPAAGAASGMTAYEKLRDRAAVLQEVSPAKTARDKNGNII